MTNKEILAIADAVEILAIFAEGGYVTADVVQQAAERLEAIIERAESPLSRAGNMTVERATGETMVNEVHVPLTPSEEQLMRILAGRPDKIVRKKILIQRMGYGGKDPDKAMTLVRHHVKNVRRKLADAGLEGAEVKSVHGVGYLLTDGTDAGDEQRKTP